MENQMTEQDLQTAFAAFLRTQRPENLKPRPTLRKAILDYLGERNLKPQSYHDYFYAAEAILADWYDRNLGDFSHEECVALYKKHGGRRVPTLAMQLLRAVHNWNDVPSPIKPRKFPWTKFRPKQRVIKAHSLPALWEAAKALPLRHQLSLRLMLLCGLRHGEVQMIQRRDVDLAEGVLTLPETKNGRPHVLPLVSGVTELLKPILAAVHGEKDRVLPLGLPRKAVDRLKEAVEYHWSPHDLRRTFASAAAELDINHGVIKALLNHSVADDVTLSHYVQVSMKAKRKALEKIQAALLPAQ